jgi:hypothetical protein
MLVRDVYLYCIRNEESSLAHCIHHLLAEKKVSLDDDMSKIDLNHVDHQKVAEMVQNNVLGFHKVSIYSLRRSQKEFVFIYAVSQQDAIQYYTETFLQTPWNCQEYPLDFELARGNAVVTFRDLRKEFVSFPAMAGYFEKMM